MMTRSDTTSEGIIQITINNTKPVELVELTLSLSKFADQYKSFIVIEGYGPHLEDAKLYIKSVRTGCIEIELVQAAATSLIPLFDGVNIVLDFAKYVKLYIDYFLGRGPKPARLTKKDCEDYKTIVAPVANDSGANLTVIVKDDAKPVFHIALNSIEANALQNGAAKEIERLSAHEDVPHTEVAMYWEQARRGGGAARPPTGDRAIIEAIDPKAHPVYFPEELRDVKERMIARQANPFNLIYIVDVDLITVSGRLKAYRITKLHQIIDASEDEAAEPPDDGND